MAIALGLDIGTRTITGAVMSGSAKKLELVDFFVVPIPDLTLSAQGPLAAETVDLEQGLPPSVGELIKATLEKHKLAGIDVVASIEAKDCVIRDRIKVPFTRDDQIQKTIQFEAETHLATYDVEAMILEFHKVGEIDGESQLLLIAAPDRIVQSRLDVLKEGGVDPVALDLDAAALFNAFAATATYDPGRPTLLIDIGATSTKVLLIENGTLRMVRSLRLGALLGVPASRQIAAPAAVGAAVGGGGGITGDELSIDARFAEIENALRRLDPLAEEPFSGDDEDAPIAILTDDEYDRVIAAGEEIAAAGGDGETTPGAAAPPADAAGPRGRLAALDAPPADAGPLDYQRFLERLGLEMRRSFSTALVAPVDLICVTGGMSHREEARRFFADNYDVETIALDFSDGFGGLTDDNRDDVNRFGGVAVGLALKQIGVDRIGFDFRKDQFRFERRFEKLKYPLLSLAILTCALFLWTAFDQLGKFRAFDNQRTFVQSRSSDYFNAFFGRRPLAASGLVMPEFRKEVELWDSFLGKGEEVPAFLDACLAIRDIADVFRMAKAEKRVIFEIEQIKLDFELRTRRGAAEKTALPELTATIVYIGEDFGTGEHLKVLFANKSQFWDASPQEGPAGGREANRFKVTLTLSLKPEFARKVASR